MDDCKVDIWMPIDIGAYLADTCHLSTVMHGAYFLLLMHYWRKGPLPNDPELLANIAKMTPDAWSIAQAVLMQFFYVGEDGLLHQKRADREIEAAIAKRKSAKEKARKGAAAKWGNRCSNDAPSSASSIPQALLEQCPLPLPLPILKATTTPSPSLPVSTRLRQTEKEIENAVNPLIDKGFLILAQTASEPLAEGLQVAIPRREENINQRREETTPQKSIEALFELPSSVNQELWEAYRDMRKKKRAPMTDKAREIIIRKLVAWEKQGHDVNAILEKSISSNWTDVFEPKDAKGQPIKPPATKPTNSFVERNCE